jgi:hypothetical protein
MSAPAISNVEPGGLEEYKARTLDDGTLIEFEYAPAGYIAKSGEPRKVDWRRYYVTPPGGDRRQRVSVTTLIDSVTSKGGLPYWFEQGGIKGCHEAHRQGLLSLEDGLDTAVEVVRGRRLGAEAERGRAADRGINVHALLEEYMSTGRAPRPNDHPEPHRGFIRALVGWLLHADPEPVMVEELVCAPEYAGRMDLVARHGGRRLISWDAKTQERGCIYPQAHLQLALYNRGHRLCGGEALDGSAVVVFAANGEFRESELLFDEDAALAALAWHAHLRPVESACESTNRIEKAIRAEVAGAV